MQNAMLVRDKENLVRQSNALATEQPKGASDGRATEAAREQLSELIAHSTALSQDVQTLKILVDAAEQNTLSWKSRAESLKAGFLDVTERLGEAVAELAMHHVVAVGLELAAEPVTSSTTADLPAVVQELASAQSTAQRDLGIVRELLKAQLNHESAGWNSQLEEQSKSLEEHLAAVETTVARVASAIDVRSGVQATAVAALQLDLSKLKLEADRSSTLTDTVLELEQKVLASENSKLETERLLKESSQAAARKTTELADNQTKLTRVSAQLEVPRKSTAALLWPL